METTTTEKQTEAVLAWLEPIDRGAMGMPDLDIRAMVRWHLGSPQGRPDPIEVMATLYMNAVIRPVELPMFPESGSRPNEVDWSEAYYAAEASLRDPIVTCPECGPPPAGRGSVIEGRFAHGGDGWQSCPQYVADHALRGCWHGPPQEIVAGDDSGALTACCGAAWSYSGDSATPYCKCCYAEVEPVFERATIYKMWESPDLAHFAERIARLV